MDTQLVEKYRNFVHELIKETDLKKSLKQELFYAIENDCLDMNSVVKWLTGDPFQTFVKQR